MSGPSSIWALKGFKLWQDEGEAQRGAAFFCQLAGAEHRRPMGVPSPMSKRWSVSRTSDGQAAKTCMKSSSILARFLVCTIIHLW